MNQKSSVKKVNNEIKKIEKQFLRTRLNAVFDPLISMRRTSYVARNKNCDDGNWVFNCKSLLLQLGARCVHRLRENGC